MQTRSPVVLIVDDHPDSLAVYAFGLLAMGFQPVMANNLEDGFARACELHPDVVVADIALTDPVAVGFTRRFRDDPRTSQARIIALTSLTPRTLDAAGPEPNGCDRVLLKPCSPDALAFEIHDLLCPRPSGAANLVGTPPAGAAREGQMKPCPQCRGTLVFKTRLPILTVGGDKLERDAFEIGHGVRYERAWVCQNKRCFHREYVGEA